MSTFGTFADIHCHTLLKYVQNDNLDFWNPIGAKRIPIIGSLLISRSTAADFKTLAQGEVQIVCVAMTPPEQKILFFQGNIPSGILNAFSSYISRIPSGTIKFFQSENYNHYDLLLKEKRLYEGGQNLTETVRLPSTGKTKCRYKLVNSFSEVDSILAANNANKNERTIAVILTIESAHALGRGHINFNGVPNKFNVSDDIILKRVDAMKGIGSPEAEAWKFSPFWMTMTHAFNNDICGFAQALENKFKNILDYSEPFPAGKTPPKYEGGINTGMTLLGRKIIERLLGIDAESAARTNKGKRILVDVKHMSTKVRKEFYEIVDAHNASNSSDIIPVLMSHAAVNGKPSIDENEYSPLDTDDAVENSSGFNPWSINLYNDEIVRIHKTKGLIGLIFYEPVLGGVQRRQGKVFWSKEKWAELFGDQIEQIVKTVYNTGAADKAEVWNRICIGSDFDGQVNPVDKFATADLLPDFLVSLRSALNQPRFNPYRNIGDVPNLANKICFTNVVDFMRNYLK